jgi:hypothetical protein
MLALEEKSLSDFVDFSKVLIQKFDKVSVEKNKLILEKDSEKITVTIKDNQKLIEKVINEKFNMQTILENQKISLIGLKTLPVIDFEKQKIIKDYIDDLVFTLYFNIHIPNLGMSEASKIKTKCAKNPYYKLVNKQKQ